MSYDLFPNNKSAGTFRFGAFSFGPFLEACGYLFPCIHSGGRWYCSFGTDPRMPVGDTYPAILANDGFRVTRDEAKIMARIARNLVAIQRSLPEENKTEDARSKAEFRKEDVEALLIRATFGGPEVWPVKLRDDFVDKYEAFAAWAEKSGGFRIY